MGVFLDISGWTKQVKGLPELRGCPNDFAHEIARVLGDLVSAQHFAAQDRAAFRGGLSARLSATARAVARFRKVWRETAHNHFLTTPILQEYLRLTHPTPGRKLREREASDGSIVVTDEELAEKRDRLIPGLEEELKLVERALRLAANRPDLKKASLHTPPQRTRGRAKTPELSKAVHELDGIVTRLKARHHLPQREPRGELISTLLTVVNVRLDPKSVRNILVPKRP